MLLTAEADRIQDLLFRSTRLREVAGGSWSLERFWDEAADLLPTDDGSAPGPRATARPLVRAGGAFRAVFSGPAAREAAEEFRRDLQDLFALRFGGRISVALAPADPGVDGESMAEWELIEEADRAMLRAKGEGDPPTVTVHLPYVQPCVSCGEAPAGVPVCVDAARDEWEELCPFCAHQRSARGEIDRPFLRAYQAAAAVLEDEERPHAESLAALPDKSEDVGRFDRRGRVAYLLADGNGFGRMLSEVARNGWDPYTRLSAEVSGAGLRALAAAAACLAGKLPRGTFDRIPVLPLITGGDDVFALLPAPWAFWTAHRFAREFVAAVGAAAGADTRPVSVSCALVFCKDTFPYRIAHRVGEDALREAKRASRLHPGVSLIRGVELRDTAAGEGREPAHAAGTFAVDTGGHPRVPVQRLFEERRTLAELPPKRRHQVEALYARFRQDGDWESRRKWLADRSRDDGKLLGVLDRLDAESAAGPGIGEQPGTCTAVVDLLHLWDYLQEPSTPEARP